MRYANYDELIQHIKGRQMSKVFGVVMANESHTMDAVLRCYQDGVVIPYLIGDAPEIRRMLDERGFDAFSFEVIHEQDPARAAEAAVSMVHSGAVQGIMKGKLETSQLMRVILRSESKLRVSEVVCAMSVMELSRYHKLIAASDPALCIAPTLHEKAVIIRNAVQALRNMGIDRPKVAVLAPVETTNPQIPETIDAVHLKEMGNRGEFGDCIVDGRCPTICAWTLSPRK